MQFNDPVNDTGLIQDIDMLCGTTSATYPINDKTRNINQHYHQVVATIWEVVDGWQYDDSNKNDLPILVADLVNEQQDYELPSTAQRIERVEVLDSNGNYQKLKQIDWHDIEAQAMTEFLETPGLPIYYDLVGRSIFLYPPPSSKETTLTEGLKIYINRDIDEFTPGDTTKEPGFAKPFHRLLSLGAAIDYEKDPTRLARLVREKDKLEKALKTFYSKRHIERKTAIRPYNKKHWRQYI